MFGDGAGDGVSFKTFGGERIIKIIQTMGQDENECICYPVITAAIRKAQKDIKKKARANNRVDSMEEWFQYNLNGTEL